MKQVSRLLTWALLPAAMTLQRADGAPPIGFGVWADRGVAQRIPAGAKLVQGPPKGRLPEFTAEEKRRGYVVFGKNYLETVYPTTTPKRSEIRSAFSIFASLGEFEPLTFCVYAIKPLTAAVVVSDLVRRDGKARLPKENIDVRAMSPVYRAKGADYKLVSNIMEKTPQVAVAAGRTRQFWLTVFVPKETAPGVYRGSVRLTVGESSSDLAVRLRVLPFELREPDVNRWMYFHLDKRLTGVLFPRNLRKYLLDMKAHGMTSVIVKASPKVTVEGDRVTCDFTKPGRGWDMIGMEQMMDMLKECGLTGEVVFSGAAAIGYFGAFGPYYNAYTRKKDPLPVREKIFRQIVTQIKAKADEEGWRLIFKPFDEPANHPERMKFTKYALRLLKDLGVKTHTTLNGLWKGVDDGKEFGQDLDYHDYNWVTPEVIADTRKRGKILYVYNGGSGATVERGPYSEDRCFWGFYVWKTGAKGISQWIYYDADWAMKSAGAFDLQRSDGYFYVFPTERGPVPTAYWECTREGIDDLKYMHTLDALMKQAAKSRDKDVATALAEAREVVKSVLDEISPEFLTRKKGPMMREFPVRFFDASRWKIARSIIELNKAMAP